jgi:hypothetical protein
MTSGAPSKEAVAEYLAKHRIHDLFNALCTSLCIYQPRDVKAFLIEELERRKSQGTEMSLLTVGEIEAIFDLNDLAKKGKLTRSQCKAALHSMSTSAKQEADINAMEVHEQVEK